MDGRRPYYSWYRDKGLFPPAGPWALM
jgi:hypothetical protein